MVNHFTEEGLRYDAVRTRFLNGLNIKVLRFENVRVFEDLDRVLAEIKAVLDQPDSDPRF